MWERLYDHAVLPGHTSTSIICFELPRAQVLSGLLTGTAQLTSAQRLSVVQSAFDAAQVVRKILPTNQCARAPAQTSGPAHLQIWCEEAQLSRVQQTALQNALNLTSKTCLSLPDSAPIVAHPTVFYAMQN